LKAIQNTIYSKADDLMINYTKNTLKGKDYQKI